MLTFVVISSKPTILNGHLPLWSRDGLGPKLISRGLALNKNFKPMHGISSLSASMNNFPLIPTEQLRITSSLAAQTGPWADLNQSTHDA